MTELLVGGYTADAGGSARGIGRARIAPDGSLEYRGLAAEADSPSWLLVHEGVVYAALEAANRLGAWRIVDDRLEPLGEVATPGEAPCHLAVANGRLLAANYLDGALTVHRIRSDGSLDEVSQRLAGSGSGPLSAQQGPHAHHVLPLPDGRVLAADLGADRMLVHRWEADRLVLVAEVALPSGCGPRDLVALPDGRIALLGEWDGTVHLLAPDGDSFRLVASLPLPGREGSQAAGLRPAHRGSLLVAGLRGADAVVSVAVDPLEVRATVPSGGHWPRHLLVDDETVYVSNQLGDSVAGFRIAADGALAPLGAPAAVPSPTCLAVVG